MTSSCAMCAIYVSFIILPAVLSAASVSDPLSRSTTSFPIYNEDSQSGEITTWSDAPKSWLLNAGKDWMKHVPGNTALNKLSVPGTHDSAALHGGAACRTQTWDIKEQLDSGIRYLDIRLRRTGTSFALHHGPCFQNLFFGAALNTLRQFLIAHSTETIIMRVKEEHTAMDGSEPFGAIWNLYMHTYGDMFVPTATTIPTLGQVRGKIFVLEQASFTGYGMKYSNSLTDIQDSYKVYYLANDFPFGSDTVSLSQKIRLVNSYISRAATSSKLVLNHLSGGTGMTPVDVARATNGAAYSTIGTYSTRKTLGVVIMDFPGSKVIYRILRTNF